nr:MAG TPA: hypothetical protein [Caudoviricetes sp.]
MVLIYNSLFQSDKMKRIEYTGRTIIIIIFVSLHCGYGI